MSRLEIKGLQKSYGSINAVDGLSLEVKDGELLAILGPSGCGKSTLLSCLAGIENVNRGCIRMGNKLLFESGSRAFIPPEDRNIGFVFQNYALWPHMTVEGNIAYPLKMRKLPGRMIRNDVDRMLDMLHLTHKKKMHPVHLSGGEQQRVALGRALIMKPELLLLDEPLSNLDAKLRERMQIEIRNIQQALGVTTIHVTHDQSEALAMSDRLAVMNKGKLVQIGSPSAIYTSPESLFIADFMGINNLVRGQVRSSKGQLYFFSDNSDSFRIKVDNDQAPVSDNLVCIIRPEDISLSMEEVSGDSAGRAVIVGKIYKGSHIIYTVITDKLKLQVLAHSCEMFEKDREVYLRVNKAGFLSGKENVPLK